MRTVAVAPRLYLNGFPKSGLHLFNLMAAGMAGFAREKNWLGTFAGNSWTIQWADLDRFEAVLRGIPGGFFIKGHAGYHERVARALREGGFAHIVVHRELRAVAVSQAFHILSDDDDRFTHPGKARFRALGGFQAVLEAVITGLDEYAGLHERWQQYAPWLNDPDTLCLRYEDALRDPEAVAGQMLLHHLASALPEGMAVELPQDVFNETVARMANLSRQTAASATFREGAADGWRARWSARAEAVFWAMERARG